MADSNAPSDDTYHQVLDLVSLHRLVAIIRLDDLSQAAQISAALMNGGVLLQEFTLTNPDALKAIEEVRNCIPAFNSSAAAIGLGSVRTVREAEQAIEAGAQFIVTPILLPKVIQCCRHANIPIMPGAYTPTEIATAWEAGASMVKVFPARNLGPSYIKDVLAPLPYLRLMPTGGVDLNNMQSYFDAGAKAVGVGGNIIDVKAVAHGDWARLSEVAQAYADRAKCGDGV
jgi:2-dehydro-3-deoxyphosphogluconate aldolase / (4S)-4-hydroxy-2-oxoglutarate aldolase